jgi:hypothetical protein
MPEARKPRQPRRRKLQYARAVENYLTAGGPPRWMTRLVEIDRGIAREKRRLAEEHEAMREWAGDEFASRWREYAQRQRFDDLNELIDQHNEWFPVERNLAMDIRTRDFVLIHGRPYRREPLDADWVLERFPARP